MFVRLISFLSFVYMATSFMFTAFLWQLLRGPSGKALVEEMQAQKDGIVIHFLSLEEEQRLPSIHSSVPQGCWRGGCKNRNHTACVMAYI